MLALVASLSLILVDELIAGVSSVRLISPHVLIKPVEVTYEVNHGVFQTSVVVRQFEEVQ